MGQVLTAGVGQNPARQALIRAGLPDSVPGMTIGKVCGSGLKATHLAAQAIKCGDAEIVIAGGQENMSASPHLLQGSRDGFRMGDAKLVDSMIIDGLWDVYNNYHMGITAENVAKKYRDFASRAGRIRRRVTAESRGRAEGGPVPGGDCADRGRLAQGRRLCSIPMNSSAPAPRSRRSASSSPPSARTARSPPAMPRASTTGRRR